MEFTNLNNLLKILLRVEVGIGLDIVSQFLSSFLFRKIVLSKPNLSKTEFNPEIFYLDSLFYPEYVLE